MRVPNAENAVVDLRKLTHYLLDPDHKDGRNKARLFRAALDLTAKNAEVLRDALLEAVKYEEAKYGRFDRYGQRYTVDFSFNWQGKYAIIRSGWLVEHDSAAPRLTTAYPK